MPTSVVARSLESMQIHLKQIFLFSVKGPSRLPKDNLWANCLE